MRHQLRRALVALAVSGTLIGGGSAIAHAATARPTTKASATASSSSRSTSASTSTAKHNCPND
jgi:hypothetical protein